MTKCFGRRKAIFMKVSKIDIVVGKHHSFYVRKKTVDMFFCISNDGRFRLKWAVSLKNAKYR